MFGEVTQGGDNPSEITLVILNTGMSFLYICICTECSSNNASSLSYGEKKVSPDPPCAFSMTCSADRFLKFLTTVCRKGMTTPHLNGRKKCAKCIHVSVLCKCTLAHCQLDSIPDFHFTIEMLLFSEVSITS